MALFASLASALRRVDGVAQILAGLETDVLRGGDGDLLVGAGVAAFARFALAHCEAAESGNGAALAALTVAGVALTPDTAEAGRRRRKSNNCCQTSSCCNSGYSGGYSSGCSSCGGGMMMGGAPMATTTAPPPVATK